MYRLDLHTHSIMSYDGSITEKEYEDVLKSKKIDYIAITDHNCIDFAQKLHKKLGDIIIVGEEIMTNTGEVIGLFLTEKVNPGMSVGETIAAIHRQGGLVYIPHPFDSFRQGIGEEVLLHHAKNVDIIEGFNGRMLLHWQNKKAQRFAKQQHMTMATGSDAHSIRGIGFSYTEISKPCTRKNLLRALQDAHYCFRYQQWYAYVYPFVNKLRKKMV